MVEDQRFASTRPDVLVYQTEPLTEDVLIAQYRSAADHIAHAVEQHPAPPIHSMPHPSSPGLADHRGR